MKKEVKKSRNEKGIVMVIALMMLTVLILLGTAAIITSTTDFKISVNYRASRQAFYVAEAGIEHGKKECVKRYQDNGWTSFTPLLSGSTTAAAGLTFGSSVSFNNGTYTVTVANDTGDSGGAATDTNGTIILTSVGTFGGGTSTIKTTIAINDVPPVPGSINLVGESEASFSGNSFTIDGRNYNMDGTLANAANPTDGARYGISVCDVTGSSWMGSDAVAKQTVLNAISSQQKDNIQGKDYAAGPPVTPSVGMSDELTKAKMTSFVDMVKGVADNVLTNPAKISGNTSGADNNVTVSNQVGGVMVDQTISFGSTANPQITYVDKSDAGWEITGNISGAGLLVINGQDMVFKGKIDWTGLVVVFGNNVGFGAMGGGNAQNITGGLIVCETSTDKNYFELVAQGATTLKYSKAAIDMVKNKIQGKSAYRVVSWESAN